MGTQNGFVMPMKQLIINLIFRLKQTYLRNRYNDFTIANYFREQGARIGQNNRLEIRSLGPEPYLVTIANHCTVAGNVRFLTHDGGVWVFTEEVPDLQKFGPITILDNCFVGIDVILMGNVTIGPNSVVGAGAVVTKNVPENMVVAGNPAHPILSLEKYKEKVLKIWSWQKPAGYFQDLDVNEIFLAENVQRQKNRELAILRQHLQRLYG